MQPRQLEVREPVGHITRVATEAEPRNSSILRVCPHAHNEPIRGEIVEVIGVTYSARAEAPFRDDLLLLQPGRRFRALAPI